MGSRSCSLADGVPRMASLNDGVWTITVNSGARDGQEGVEVRVYV